MRDAKQDALRLILLMGSVSLLGDIVYEGARSVQGPYLAVLGSSAAAVGLISGFGEFAGYVLRLFSGYLSDRTRSYWALTILGYLLILAIPMLAFAGRWETAALFFVLERIGKAIRSPARDAILSHATHAVGRGWGFGIHEALDQTGAIIGPLLFTVVLLFGGSYRQGFLLLWVPAILLVALLLVARRRAPDTERFETPHGTPAPASRGRLPSVFWFYTVFVTASAAGFASFALISFHFKTRAFVPDTMIPVLYAIAMGVDGLTALGIGRIYDRAGLKSILAIPLLSLPVPFLAFSDSYALAVASVILWGAVMGIHETVMRAAIADIVPLASRGSAYGVFNTAYGLAWLFGTTAMGVLYERSAGALIAFSVGAEIVSIPLLILVIAAAHRTPPSSPPQVR